MQVQDSRQRSHAAHEELQESKAQCMDLHQQLAAAQEAKHAHEQQLQMQHSKAAQLQAELDELRRLVASHAFEVSNASSAHKLNAVEDRVDNNFADADELLAPARQADAAQHSSDAGATAADRTLQPRCVSKGAAAAVLSRVLDASQQRQAALVLSRWRCRRLQSALQATQQDACESAAALFDQEARMQHAIAAFVERRVEQGKAVALQHALVLWRLAAKQVSWLFRLGCAIHILSTAAHPHRVARASAWH